MKKIILKFVTVLMLFGLSTVYASESVVADNHSSAASTKKSETYESKSFVEMVGGFLESTGINAFVNPDPNELNSHGEPMSDFHKSWGRVIMILVTFLLFYLANSEGVSVYSHTYQFFL